MGSRKNLRVINGGKSDYIRIGTVKLICQSPENRSPATIIVINEEDTWQVLSADPSIRKVDDHPIRIMTGLIDQKPLAIGDIIILDRRWQAVIYDFDQEPVCKKQWVQDTMQKLLEKTDEVKVREISMPLLGSVHGCLTRSESLEIIITAVRSSQKGCLERIWLDVAAEHLDDVRRKLLAAANEPAEMGAT